MTALSNADYSDMQGLLRFGYGKLPDACFLLLKIEDKRVASEWLAQAPITTAQTQDPPPKRALQIAFTGDGLSALSLSQDLVSEFSPEFIAGMAGDDNRSRRLGDVGANAPQQWLWGSGGATPELVVMLYAQSGQLCDWAHELEAQLSSSGFSLLSRLDTNDMGDIEPFGFADGISSPDIDWDRKHDTKRDRLEYENVTALGEFVLGYPNEYGLYTNRPLIDDANADLPEAEECPSKRDLGRNGSYLVLRQIEQDIQGFWGFFLKHGVGDRESAIRLAEHFVGRRISGEPLGARADSSQNLSSAKSSNNKLNDFTFDSDPDGHACPLGAHIRRANPRNADLPTGTPGALLGRLSRILAIDRLIDKAGDTWKRDKIASARFHRLLRRGREYGPQLSLEQRMDPSSHQERTSGLQFICLNANIGRQFEFVQSAWLNSTTFDGLHDEDDPLIGNRQTLMGCPAQRFTLQNEDGLAYRFNDIPRFTTVRGGAYFFLPGVRALRYIARIGQGQ